MKLLLFVFSISIFIIPANLQNLEECDVVLSVDTSVHGCLITAQDDALDLVVTEYYLCGSMEDMLKAVANDLIDIGLNCTKLVIPPGNHVVQGNYTFTRKNIRIVNEAENGLAIISFDTNMSIVDSLQELEPLYVWRFESCYRVEIVGLSFVDSPGIIFVSNVTYITVENDTFE